MFCSCFVRSFFYRVTCMHYSKRIFRRLHEFFTVRSATVDTLHRMHVMSLVLCKRCDSVHEHHIRRRLSDFDEIGHQHQRSQEPQSVPPWREDRSFEQMLVAHRTGKGLRWNLSCLAQRCVLLDQQVAHTWDVRPIQQCIHPRWWRCHFFWDAR